MSTRPADEDRENKETTLLKEVKDAIRRSTERKEVEGKEKHVPVIEVIRGHGSTGAALVRVGVGKECFIPIQWNSY